MTKDEERRRRRELTRRSRELARNVEELAAARAQGADSGDVTESVTQTRPGPLTKKFVRRGLYSA